MFSKDYIIGSSLPQEDKDLWFIVLEKINTDQTKVVEDFIDGREENLRQLTTNIRSKLDAITALDEKLIDKIINEERGIYF